jgi:hypothetical protein
MLRHTKQATKPSGMTSPADPAVPRQYTCDSADTLRQPLGTTDKIAEPAMPSNEKTTASASKYSQPKCLLFRLPPELRIYIYEQAMTPNIEPAASDRAGDVKSMVDLSTVASSAPSIALLLTCKLIFREAEEYFVNAQRAFWSSNTFSLEVRRESYHVDYMPQSNLPRIRGEAMDLISRLVASIETEDTLEAVHIDVQFAHYGEVGRGARGWTITMTPDFLHVERQVAGLAKKNQLDIVIGRLCGVFWSCARSRR